MNLMSLIGNLGNNKYVMAAIGAMMRGEDPQAFIKKLANTNPALQGLDLDNLEVTARALCDKNNVNMDELADKIREFASSK